MFVIGVSLLSCNSEKLIKNISDGWQVMIAVKTPNPALMIYDYPSGTVVSNDVYLQNNGESLKYCPDKMAEYAKSIFLIFTEAQKLLILEAGTYKKQTEIDFAPLNKSPLSMCFANPTTAYLIYKNDSIVDVFDLTVNQITQSIPIGKITTALACYDNQIVIANGPNDAVTIIDTRDNSVKGSISVEPYPCLVEFTADGVKAIIISAGRGKFDSTAQTNAVAQTIDYSQLIALEKVDLGMGIVKPIEQIPQSIASNAKVYTYVGTQKFLLKYITRTGTQISRVDNGNYLSVIYNPKRDEMIYLKQSGNTIQLRTADPYSSEVKATYSIPSGYVSLLPL